MRWVAGLILGAARLHAQSPATAGPDLLPRIREKMMQNLKAQPNYTCTETVERLYRTNPKAKFLLHDTVRLEVALVDGNEMFASPGAKKFETASLSELTGDTGAISNGDFALHARAIFGGLGTEFDFKGMEGNRVRFDYNVARSHSDFHLKHGEKMYLTAYHGSFEANAETLDVERISVIADQLPPSLEMKAAIKNLTFARLPIGGGTFLLPQQSELTIIDSNKTENQNITKFSRCRQFAGESVLSFDDPEPSAAPAAPAHINEVSLPLELDASLALLEEIDVDKAAVGDLVKARLISDLKQKSRMLIPKGAMATGRLTHAESHGNYFLLGIEFQELEWPGGHAIFHAGLIRMEDMPQARKIPIAPPLREGEGLIPLPTRQKTLPRGLVMFWSTTR